MQQRHKNFILLLAALACFAVGAALFIGDDGEVYDSTEQTKDPGDVEETNVTEENNDSGDETDAEGEDAENMEEEAVLSSTVTEDDDFFENYRMQREKRRDAQIELYQEILNDDSRDEEAKASAQSSLEKLYAVDDLEDKVEEILIGRNYDDVIFIMEDTVSLLIIKKSSLSDDEKAALTSFVASYAGIGADSLSVFTVR